MMSTRNPVISAIQWHEGMLLSPQHFQQTDLRQQQILSYHLHRLSPYHWGVHHLRLDSIVIPAGIIRIHEIEAIFPDGFILTRYDSDGIQDSSLEMNLVDQKQRIAEQDVFIYLCLPEQSEGSSISSDWPRYRSVEGPLITDENSVDNIIRIPRLEPQLKLIADTHPPARYTSIPIASIGYADEAFFLKPYIPPCFMVSPSSQLGEMCCQLTQRIREKACYLTEKYQGQIGSMLMGETATILRPLIQSLPLLEPLLQNSHPDPHTLYLKICEVAGHFACLKVGTIPPIFPAYRHSHILSSFMSVLDWMNDILSTINRKISILPLHHRDRLFFIKMNPLYLYDQSLLIGVRAASGMSAAELRDWVNECVICTESFVEMARLRRITGAHRQLVQYADLSEAMSSADINVYRITMDPEFIDLTETLMIFHAADSFEKRPVDIVLYVKGEQSIQHGEEVFDE